MADASEQVTKTRRVGCLGRLLGWFVFLGLLALAACVYQMSQSQDLSDLGGMDSSSQPTPVRDLKVVLKNSLDRGYAVTLTETEINQWLDRTLKLKQGGLFADRVSLDRVLVRLKDGMAEVILVRKIMGKPMTVSMFLQIEQTQGAKAVETAVHLHGGKYHPDLPYPLIGGYFGKLPVPQGFLRLVLPSFKKIPLVLGEEIELGVNRMARVKIEKNRLILDPNEPGGDMLGFPGSF